MISRALTRKGTALAKLAKTSKDYDVAIETFQKALTEHRNPDTLKKLNDAERSKKELEQQEYYDPKIADEEREKGMPMWHWHRHSICSRCSLFMQFFFPAIIGDADDEPYLFNSCAGNEFFKQQKYPEAVKHYTEALRRNPKDPKVISSYSTFN